MTFSKLYVHRAAFGMEKTSEIVSSLGMDFEIVENAEKLYAKISAEKDPVSTGKKILFLTKNRGAFLKNCPGTRKHVCCGYKILHLGTGCTMDCSYCILQAYFHPPVLHWFVNQGDMKKELESAFSGKKPSRIGTGEFTDSMIWEKHKGLGLARILVGKFAGQSSAVLELKTKTSSVESLRGLNHNRKTIAAWSVNTEKIIRTEERGTATLQKRLDAAAQCEKWGYPLAFHFDPMIIYDGCEEDYRRTIESIFASVSPENVVWISLGTFRFMPALKPLIEQRFKKSKIVYGEFIKGEDNKMRYFKPLRIALYKRVLAVMKDVAPGVLLYFCMEDRDVWERTLGFAPEEKGGLPAMLDRSAVKHCGLKLVNRERMASRNL